MIKNNKFMCLGVMGGVVFALAFAVVPMFALAAGYSQIGGNTTLRVGV